MTIYRIILITLIYTIVFTSTIFAHEISITGRVIRVYDGDTIQVQLDSGKTETIRFLGIDTPESYKTRFGYTEYLGDEAKTYIKQILYNKMVRIESYKKNDDLYRDRYGRILGYVYCDNRDISLQLLERGLAKVYRRVESSRHSEFIRYEKAARDKSIGIWDLERSRLYYRKQYERTKNRFLLLWFWDNDRDYLKKLVCND
jgi:micrococcal nuclease